MSYYKKEGKTVFATNKNVVKILKDNGFEEVKGVKAPTGGEVKEKSLSQMNKAELIAKAVLVGLAKDTVKDLSNSKIIEAINKKLEESETNGEDKKEDKDDK